MRGENVRGWENGLHRLADTAVLALLMAYGSVALLLAAGTTFGLRILPTLALGVATVAVSVAVPVRVRVGVSVATVAVTVAVPVRVRVGVRVAAVAVSVAVPVPAAKANAMNPASRILLRAMNVTSNNRVDFCCAGGRYWFGRADQHHA